MLLNLLACVYQYAKCDIPHVFAHLTFLSRNYLSVVHLCHIKVEWRQKIPGLELIRWMSSSSWGVYSVSLFVLPPFWLGKFLICVSKCCLSLSSFSCLCYLACYFRSAAAMQSRSCYWRGRDGCEEMFSNTRKQNVCEDKQLLFSIFRLEEPDIVLNCGVTLSPRVLAWGT